MVGAAGAMAGAAGAVEATTDERATAAEAMLAEAMPAVPEVTRSTVAVDITAPQAEASTAAAVADPTVAAVVMAAADTGNRF
jgi:hypothetical protein